MYNEKLINFDDIKSKEDLKQYFIENKVQVKWIEGENKNFINFIENDILIYFIENNASLEIIEFIIVKGYSTLNYISFCNKYMNNSPLYNTPLSCAIQKQRYDIADLLINYGAEFDSIPYDNFHYIINTENLKYFMTKNYNIPIKLIIDIFDKDSDYEYNSSNKSLTHDFLKQIFNYLIVKQKHISSQLIILLIKNNYNDILNYIFKHYVLNKDFILKLILCYKNQITVSKSHYQEIIASEMNKINFNSLFYKTAIEKNNYNAMNILCNYDIRGNKIIIEDICNLLKVDFVSRNIQDVLTSNRPELKKVFLNKMKNSKLRYHVNPKLLTCLENTTTYNEDKENIVNLIEQNNYFDFIRNIKNNNVNVTKFHFKVFDSKVHNYKKKDIIGLAIENNVSPVLLDFIINQCLENNKNFIGNRHLHFLYYALYKNKFRISEYILKKFEGENFELIFRWLYNSKTLNNKNLNFILYHNLFYYRNQNDIDNSKISSFLHSIEYIPRCSLNQFLRYYTLSNNFILKLLSYYKNKTILSKNNLNDIIMKENSKFNSSWIYPMALQDYNPEELNILYKYDIRDKKIIINDIINILNKLVENDNDMKNKFMEDINNNIIKIPIEEKYLNQLKNSKLIKNYIIEKIEMNQINELSDFIKNNYISLSHFNKKNDDILTFAIKSNASLKMIKYLMSQYSSLNYMVYYANGSPLTGSMPLTSSIIDVPYSPLSLSLCLNKYKISQILIEGGADINYKLNNYNKNETFDIISYLNKIQKINHDNLKFIINNGFNLTLEHIKLFIEDQDDNEQLNNRKRKRISYNYNNNTYSNNNEENTNNNKKDKGRAIHYMKTLIKYYSYDNIFVLKLILLSKNKSGLSYNQLQNILLRENNKICLSKELINIIMSYKNENVMKILFDYGIKSNAIYSESSELLPFIVAKNSLFIQYLFKYNLLDYTQFNLEDFIVKLLPLDDELKTIKMKNNDKPYPQEKEHSRYLGIIHFKNLKLFLEEYLKHELNNNFSSYKNENYSKIILRIYQKLYMKATNADQLQEGLEFLEKIILNLLFHETFYFHHYDNNLLKLCSSDLQIIMLKKSLLHKNFDLSTININSILLYLKGIDEDNSKVFNFFVNEILNNKKTFSNDIITGITDFLEKLKE
ncbi:hypothetical protein PIROE2DRAFT_15391 [Piromyces sp. E2]|nr:hypothetical protein PIROE2DRAFT_15391 [Piromyces sp. E2]|eukprot:OUM59165.1 hypothetical protein PIROE2DRAFT_15391 [Piromyces sp. E2]